MEENKQSGMKKFAGAEELNTEADMITHISIPYSDQVHVFLLDSLP